MLCFQLLGYNASAVCIYNPQTGVAVTCGIQHTGVVTMAMEVLYHSLGKFMIGNIHEKKSVVKIFILAGYRPL